MLQLLVAVLPLGLAAAVSPVLLTEQTVLLAGPDGRRTATSFLLGACAVLLFASCALVLFGRAIALPDDPDLVAALDVAIGAALVCIAAVLHRRRPAQPLTTPPMLNSRRALGFGVFSMATNFTTLAFLVPAARVIAASDVPVYGHLLGVMVLVGLAAIPVWVPIALTSVAPGPASRGLGALATLIERRGRVLAVLALLAIGAILIVHGLISLSGH